MRADIVLVGGGLANCLIGYRLRQVRPELDIVLLEKDARLGGRHTWSFHTGDLSSEQRAWLAPLVEQSWPHHEVRFPNRRRSIESGYHSLISPRVHEVVTEAIGDKVLTGTQVAKLNPKEVHLTDGSVIQGGAVIDGRGNPGGGHFEIAYQKFVGLVVRIDREHGLEGPILMDGTVPQLDGYRFIYTLPFSEKKLLIEDTRYSDSPSLDRETMRRLLAKYAEAQGWKVEEVESEEVGVLPIVLSGDIHAFWQSAVPDVPRSGMRAALFHPTTGYSLPEAVRMADALSQFSTFDSPVLFEWVRRRSMEAWKRNGYFRLLNTMLFKAAEPKERYRVFQRFYGLSESLIRRFYAGHLNWSDKLRLVIGSPPVPIGRALRCLLETRTRTEDGHETRRETT